MITKFFTFPGLNPEPWAIGVSSWRTVAGKRVPGPPSPVPQLVNYQNAIRNQIKSQLGDWPMISGHVHLSFWLWRQLGKNYLASGRTSQKKVADNTNVQKATEDALQGILFPNDNVVKHIQTTLVEEGPDVDPGLIIRIRHFTEPFMFGDDLLLAEFNKARRDKYRGLQGALVDELRM